MRWNSFWDRQARSNNPSKQVGRIVRGKPAEPGVNKQIVEHITRLLRLESQHTLLDLCCGNGELSVLLARKCGHVVGVDFSAGQLAHAQKHLLTKANLEFKLADVQSLQLQQKFDRINLYFSFQYFVRNRDAENVLKGIFEHLKPGGWALLGDIPNAEKEHNYYQNISGLVRARCQSLLGRNPMGRFWNPQSLSTLAERIGFMTRDLPEPTHLPYAHYRFDLLLTRPE